MIGTTIENALTMVGVTSERVERWLGKPCKCKERKEKLDALGHWAQRVLSGKVDQAKDYLERIING